MSIVIFGVYCGHFPSRKPAISRKGGKTGPRLLLTTNRKLHTRFRFVPKSTTLDDLERTPFQNACAFLFCRVAYLLFQRLCLCTYRIVFMALYKFAFNLTLTLKAN